MRFVETNNPNPSPIALTIGEDSDYSRMARQLVLNANSFMLSSGFVIIIPLQNKSVAKENAGVHN